MPYLIHGDTRGFIICHCLLQENATNAITPDGLEAKAGIESSVMSTKDQTQSSEQRYRRQLGLPFWSQQAQDRLAKSHAMIIGCGALGCPSADLLARAGVGKITLVDRDIVECSNLHRQTLFDNQDAIDQVPKAQAAKRRLQSVNPEIQIEAIVADFNAYDAEHIFLHARFAKPDVILDGTDNFETRFLINDLSVMHAIPYVYGGAIATRGMAAVFVPTKTPCLRCLMSVPPSAGSQPTCETAGVFAPVSAIIGAYQASEALKLLIGADERVMGSLLEFDLWEGQRRRMDLAALKDPQCPCCVDRNFEYLDREDEETQSICGRKAIQINPSSKSPVAMDALHKSLATQGQFVQTTFMIKGTLDEPINNHKISLTVFGDGRAIIEGIDDPALARTLYARYIGS